MAKIITLCLLLTGVLGFSQDIETALTEKIKVLEKSYTNKELEPLANDFERIALGIF